MEPAIPRHEAATSTRMAVYFSLESTGDGLALLQRKVLPSFLPAGTEHILGCVPVYHKRLGHHKCNNSNACATLVHVYAAYT